MASSHSSACSPHRLSQIDPNQDRHENSSTAGPTPHNRDSGGDSVADENNSNGDGIQSNADSPPPVSCSLTFSTTLDHAHKSPVEIAPKTSSSSHASRHQADSFNGRRPPLRLHLASESAALGVDAVTAQTISLPAYQQAPSIPINIPPQSIDRDRVITPLTARIERETYFPLHFGSPPSENSAGHLSPSTYPPSSANLRASQLDDDSPPSFDMSPHRDHPSVYHPTSPLSSTSSAPIPIPPSLPSQQRPRRPARHLNLPGLPKYHPANFPTSDSNVPLSPRTVRNLTSQPRVARGAGSDAQQKLHQYQRDMIANASRTSTTSIVAPALMAKPTSPRLLPEASPGPSMTPLTLEGQSDYLLAGSQVHPSNLQSVQARDWVEKLVQKENERRAHPEARSGSLSPGISPAVSPAGGCI